MIVLDASGSMNNKDASGTRIDAAKRAVDTVVDALPDGTSLGMIVYGTSTDGSDAAKAAGCQDSRTIVPMGPLDRRAFAAAVHGVVASGYTPIGSALRTAVAQLPQTGPRTVIVVSDGIDTCAPPDACAVATEIADPGLAVHTVGFQVDAQARQQLGCIADAAGGSYVDAGNAAQLAARLRSAVDPSTAVNALTRTGFGGLELGMTVVQARAVDPGITASEAGAVRVVWRDCELTFVDGRLTAITSTSAVATQDGLRVGDDVSRAIELYGDGAVQEADGSARMVVPTGDRGESGYAITFVPDSASAQPRGRVTAIELCLCRPAQSVATSASGSSVPATEIVKLTPFDVQGNIATHDGFYPGGDPFRQLPTGEVRPSEFGGTAYDVTGVEWTTGGVVHSCWPTDPLAPDMLLCLPDPEDKFVQEVQVNSHPPPLKPVSNQDPSVRPTLIELDDHRVCRARTDGSTSLRVTYLCHRPGVVEDDEVRSTVGALDKSAALWTIKQVDATSLDDIVDRENPPTRTATIVRAWMNG